MIRRPPRSTQSRSSAASDVYKRQIANSVYNMSLLNMPQFSKEAIEGVRRCFNLYLLLDEKRWPEIELAEQLTPEGDKIWENLIAECRERFFSPSATKND